jgi:hypothetical protein
MKTRQHATLKLAVALCNLSDFEDQLEGRNARGFYGYLSDAEREQHAYLVEQVNQDDAALRAARKGRAA